ncbi:MAG TPA: A24 family peptidase [Bacilli bacterium]|nr:A24 family peptidase [Bacilli bacterium]
MHLTWGLALAVCCVAVYTDLRERRIPNLLTVSALVVGFALNGWLVGLSGLTSSLYGVLLGLLLLFPFFLRGGIGGGDVKLLMALGALCGPGFLFYAFLYGAVAGGIGSLAVLVRHNRWRLALAGLAVAREATTGLSIPYAVPILIGVLVECVRRTYGWF